MSWTHRACERCYLYGKPDVLEPAAQPVEGGTNIRMPTLLVQTEVEPGMCCFCGFITVIGLYVRADPKLLPCRGEHPS